MKYIVRAEMYENNTFTIKYYASIHKKLDAYKKYSMLTNQYNARKIFNVCINIFLILLKNIRMPHLRSMGQVLSTIKMIK
ncbi:hypothetical protein EZS27_006023 [termite gut metagenome]|uniref:Uncharacterized protein n=1 Tax=termite gut metagenome TaxID=433724 RepID=A0A5J4SM66_9ZZZZ